MSGLESFTENSFSEIMLAGDLVLSTQETELSFTSERNQEGSCVQRPPWWPFWPTGGQKKVSTLTVKNVGPQYLALGFGHSLRTAKWGSVLLTNVVHSPRRKAEITVCSASSWIQTKGEGGQSESLLSYLNLWEL